MKRRVVITGLGTYNPLGNDVASTWQKVVNGESGIAPITLFDASALKTRIGGEIKGFDPAGLLGRRSARKMDRVTQIALASATQALQDAQLNNVDRHRVGVIIGNGLGSLDTIVKTVETAQKKGINRISPFFMPMMLADTPAGTISIEHGLRGPNMVIATACASANNAMGEAARTIQRGDADIILTGGADAGVIELGIAGFSVMGALTTLNDHPTRASRPFDKNRDGFVPAEGGAILIFEERQHALARNATIYAEFLGYGTSADAYHISSPAEDGSGAVNSMRYALQDAGLTTTDIDYVNAHGTSTSLNDSTETKALKTVFGERAYAVPISSTKSMHGHLLGAAGALEALIVTKVLQEQCIPATINYETPDPACDLDYVVEGTRPGKIRTVMSNSFGFGGHNATIIIGTPA